MSIAFAAFGMILFVTMPNAVMLSVLTGVGGLGCPSLNRVLCMSMAFGALMKSAPNAASAVDDMTALIICAVLRTTPLSGGKTSVFERKKCPPVQLRACFSLKYDASLWIANTMLLALYVDIALLYFHQLCCLFD